MYSGFYHYQHKIRIPGFSHIQSAYKNFFPVFMHILDSLVVTAKQSTSENLYDISFR